MKKNALLLIILVVFIAACSTSKKTDSTGVHDGSSFEKAILIKAKTDLSGVNEEYAWLKKNYPGYKSQGQTLINKNKRIYDKLKITTAEGDIKEFYFDITNCFGKF
jgi:outer membrane protein assembly factor BamD (BamD/ComL family)